MTEPHRCCQVTVNDLRAAHRRVAALELQLLILQAHNDNLTTVLADVTFERDQLRRERAATTIHNIQTREAA